MSVARSWWQSVGKTLPQPKQRLDGLHSVLKFRHGSLQQEYPEQLMAVQFVEPGATVLELGGNIGRNSCVIGSLLDDESRLVVLETNPGDAQKLIENRDANGLRFRVEAAALSQRPLIQQGWTTKELRGAVPSGWKAVQTLNWVELLQKHELAFDTLVADCEGALELILADAPSILDVVSTIIVENDYTSLETKHHIDDLYRQHGFELIYSEPLNINPRQPLLPAHTCHREFYQVWRKP